MLGRVLALLVVLLLPCVLSARAQHIHVQLSYSAATQWRLFIYDFDSGDFDPANVPIFTGHQAFNFLPANSFTNFLGPAAGGVWTLPETENADLLYLGIGTSGIAPGVFVNNQIRLHVRSLSGPGHFALYNVDPFGSPVVHMNSRDGIGPAADAIALSSVGGHVHVNWTFSGPGTYRVGLAASARLAATDQTNASSTIDYTFIVEDIPWRPRIGIAQGFHSTPPVVLHGTTGWSYAVDSSGDARTWFRSTNFAALSTETEIFPPRELNETQLFRARVIAQ